MSGDYEIRYRHGKWELQQIMGQFTRVTVDVFPSRVKAYSHLFFRYEQGSGPCMVAVYKKTGHLSHIVNIEEAIGVFRKRRNEE